MQDEGELVAWFKDEILPEIIREGRFPTGKNPRIASAKFLSTERFVDHFASSPYFLELVIDSDDGRKTFDLLVKFCSQNDQVVKDLHLERMFLNESNIYGKVLPAFREVLLKNPKVPSDLIEQIIPKCYYTRYDKENTKKSLLVFQNQGKFGFRTAQSKLYLDYDHSAAALRQLGRFHALSLSTKIKCPETLKELKESLIESRFHDDPNVYEFCDKFLITCNQRGVDHLLSQNPPPIPTEYLLKMQKMLSQPLALFRRLITPKEPSALICHGDFCRNNMLFRYDGDLVADVNFFDFQMTRYASPTIDLVFFFYLNMTQELRDKHFDEFLTIYHSSLISTTALILDVPETDLSARYPLKTIADEFAEHAVYAYCLVAFFMPAMAAGAEIDWNQPLDERAKFLMGVGGEKLSQNIADIILDFYKRGFYVS